MAKAGAQDESGLELSDDEEDKKKDKAEPTSGGIPDKIELD